MPKVLISAKLHADGVAMLSNLDGMEVSEIAPVNGDELVDALQGFDACIVRSESKLTKEVIERCPDLRVIGRAGSGFDNIDAKFAREKNITVLNAPGGNTVTTAEHTLALMFSMARFVPQANSRLQAGNWDRSFKGVELTDKTLGVLGLGSIGAVVADRAQGLKMKVVGYDPVLPPEIAEKMGIELLQLEDVFKRVDFLTIHTPMLESTKYLVGKHCFEVCKPGLRVINCARGGLVDEAALLEALNSGKVAGAALDVYESEPATPENPLVMHPNVVCTPHLGASTTDAQVKVAKIICQNIGNFLADKDFIGLVN